MPSPGAVAANLYQGSRSEYLAQYVFSMFGTAALVPHEADYGLDLFCTRTRTDRGRAEPYAYYAVQVKSTPDPWVFDGLGSVKWILEYPAPLLFCVVEKNVAEKVAGCGDAGPAAKPDAGSGRPGRNGPDSPPCHRLGCRWPDADGAADPPVHARPALR